MKVNKKGYTYKVRNKMSGRQTIRFFEPDPVTGMRQDGTTVEEVLKTCKNKLKFELKRKGKSEKLESVISDLESIIEKLES